MDSLQFSNPNPATGKSGTLVTTTWFQNVNDEISNVITKNGGTVDSTNSEQLYQTLQTTYAPLASPTFTGVPLCPDSNSKSDGRAIVNFESMKAYVAAGSLGYTPVHQGGGTGQGTNSVYIGWATSGETLKCTVDSTDLGSFAFQSWVSSNYLALSGGNVTGTFTYNGTTVATKNDVNNSEIDTKNWVEAFNYVGSSGITSGDNNLNVNGLFYSVPVQAPFLTSYNSAGTATNYILATQDWVNGKSYATESWVSGSYVSGTASGNVSISNIQAVNYSGSDNSSAYIQVATPVGAIAVPTTGNVSAQLVNYAQPKGSYVDSSTYNNDFGTSDSRIINLAYGNRIQTFSATVYGSSQTITFPTANSSTTTVMACAALQPGTTNRAGIVNVNSWNGSSVNVTGFFLDAPDLTFSNSGLPCYFIVIGAK